MTNAEVLSSQNNSNNQIQLIHFGGNLAVAKYFRDSTTLRRRCNELDLLRKLQGHPNIVKLLAVGPDYPSGSFDYFITEFAPCGNLHDLLHKRRFVKYNAANALSWMLHLSEALSFLHEKSIIHRDVKPSNCLLFDEGASLKLCDFGFSESFDSNGSISPTPRGTAGFMAPELFASSTSASYTTKSDVFSTAMTFWEILTRKYVCPPDEPFFVTLIEQVRKHRRPCLPRNCPVFLLRLLERSWAEEPERRPQMREIASLLSCIKTSIVETKLVSPPHPITRLSPDSISLLTKTNTPSEQWEAEEEDSPVPDPPVKPIRIENYPAEELKILPTSPVQPELLGLHIICDENDDANAPGNFPILNSISERKK